MPWRLGMLYAAAQAGTFWGFQMQAKIWQGLLLILTQTAACFAADSRADNILYTNIEWRI